MIRVIPAFIAFLAAFGANAESFMPSEYATPDITISATSSADYVLRPRGFVDWIYIRNDGCGGSGLGTLYFNLGRGDRDTDYPLRLNATADSPGQVFSGPLRVHTLSVSNNNSSACTFTVQGGTR